jgi:putative oxidoreductase
LVVCNAGLQKNGGLENMKDYASLFLRLGLGVVFIIHGIQKIFPFSGSGGIDNFSLMLSELGIPTAVIVAYVVAISEIICGLALLLGFYTRAACTLLLIIMGVALFKVHLPKGFFVASGGYEYVFMIVCACLSLFSSGGGKFSITKRV